MKNFKRREDIVIKKSNKGDKIVVETREHYINDGLSHLLDKNVYNWVEEDINPNLHKAIEKFLNHSLNRV